MVKCDKCLRPCEEGYIKQVIEGMGYAFCNTCVSSFTGVSVNRLIALLRWSVGGPKPS